MAIRIVQSSQPRFFDRNLRVRIRNTTSMMAGATVPMMTPNRTTALVRSPSEGGIPLSIFMKMVKRNDKGLLWERRKEVLSIWTVTWSWRSLLATQGQCARWNPPVKALVWFHDLFACYTPFQVIEVVDCLNRNDILAFEIMEMAITSEHHYHQSWPRRKHREVFYPIGALLMVWSHIII